MVYMISKLGDHCLEGGDAQPQRHWIKDLIWTPQRCHNLRAMEAYAHHPYQMNQGTNYPASGNCYYSHNPSPFQAFPAPLHRPNPSKIVHFRRTLHVFSQMSFLLFRSELQKLRREPCVRIILPRLLVLMQGYPYITKEHISCMLLHKNAVGDLFFQNHC
jgi:hypothetical protein